MPLYGTAILTPDSIMAGSWKLIKKEIESKLLILDEFWVSPLSINTIRILYSWPETLTLGMILKAKLFSLGPSRVLYIISYKKEIDPSIILKELKGSSQSFMRSNETIRSKYGAINSFINLLHSSNDSNSAIRDYKELIKYKTNEFYENRINEIMYHPFKNSKISDYENFVFCEVIVLILSKLITAGLILIEEKYLSNPNNYDSFTIEQWLLMISTHCKHNNDRIRILIYKLCECNKYSPSTSKKIVTLLKESKITLDDFILLVLQTNIYNRILRNRNHEII